MVTIIRKATEIEKEQELKTVLLGCLTKSAQAQYMKQPAYIIHIDGFVLNHIVFGEIDFSTARDLYFHYIRTPKDVLIYKTYLK